MERQFPKNVKQIGNVSDEPRIYVEDYVDIYLNQLKEQAAEKPAGAALVGEILTQEGQRVVYISGAMLMAEVRAEGTEVKVKEGAFRELEGERKKYFPEGEIIGWCLIESGHPMGQAGKIDQIHNRVFPKDDTVFIWKDALENEEIYYAYKYGELMQMGGHYIYYEKNPSMQNYMIMTRKKNGVTPSEMVEDRAAKNFRSTVRGKMEDREQQRSSRLVYLTSVLLVVVVLAIGISTMNNFDKMEAVQDSLETLSQSVSQVGSQTETVSGDEEDDAEAQAVSAEDITAVTEAGSTESTDGTSTADGTDAADSTGAIDGANAGTMPDPSTIQEQLSDEDYYIVKKGDTLDSISMKLYGNTAHVEAICKMNGLSDGNLIYIGQKLLLP